METMKAKTTLFAILGRGCLFLLIWWILADGVSASWLIGVPAVALAITASVALLSPLPLIWHELLRFAPFFLLRSFLGGVGVAWRAFHPTMPVTPAVIEYPLRLPPGITRVFMAGIVNLLPGTLCIAFEADTMKIHVLDSSQKFAAELEAVEQRVARMFGMSASAMKKGQ